MSYGGMRRPRANGGAGGGRPGAASIGRCRVGLNRYHKRNTHLYFEEILWFLEEPIVAEYISMIWTRGRKWRCCPVAVSQLLERLMSTPVGRTIVKTSDLTRGTLCPRCSSIASCQMLKLPR
jgi:hypothetical protein